MTNREMLLVATLFAVLAMREMFFMDEDDLDWNPRAHCSIKYIVDGSSYRAINLCDSIPLKQSLSR